MRDDLASSDKQVQHRFEEAVAARQPRNREMEWLNDTFVSNREVAER
ncbi:MAG: hypothetical protein WCC17_21150 [Candidatus Nitrosopolaris sp.]